MKQFVLAFFSMFAVTLAHAQTIPPPTLNPPPTTIGKYSVTGCGGFDYRVGGRIEDPCWVFMSVSPPSSVPAPFSALAKASQAALWDCVAGNGCTNWDNQCDAVATQYTQVHPRRTLSSGFPNPHPVEVERITVYFDCLYFGHTAVVLNTGDPTRPGDPRNKQEANGMGIP